MPRPLALITGASAGIGLELAKQLACDGYDLLLTARREDRLRQIADDLTNTTSASITIFIADLADPASPQNIYDFTKENNLTIDTLINNAGFGLRKDFHESDLPRLLEMIQVNITALTHLTGLFLPDMIKRKNGTILNVASTAAFTPGPHMAVYYATKAFVLHFSEAIASELQNTGVTVSCLCPGPTNTEFGEVSGMSTTKVFKFAVPVEPVVTTAIKGMKKKKKIIIPGFGNRAGIFFMRFTPRIIVRYMVGKLQR